MDEDDLADLRRLLREGQITPERFRRLGGGASADLSGGGAVAQGDGASAIGERAVEARDVYGQVRTGDEYHLHVGGTEPDPAPLRRAYLQRVWKRADALPLFAGGDTKRAVRLGAIYTALMTDLPAAPPDRGRGARDGALVLAEEHRRTRSAVEVLDGESRLVLLGGPGSGKSTFVHFVAQVMAGELLGAEADAPEPNLATLTAPLPAEESAEKPNPPQPWRHGALLPVVVVLRDLTAQLPAAGEPVGADNVWRYLCNELRLASQEDFAPALKAELRDRGGLVMFDGSDEVPEAKSRREQIQRVVKDFADGFARCRILVTSRTYAYQRQDWKLPGFAEAALAAFTPAQITAFVGAWYAHMAQLQRLTATDAESRAELLLRQVQHNPRVAELAQRPLLLTLFARLQTDKGGNLPERREELYHAAVELLLNDWERMKPGLQPGAEPEPSLTEWLAASREAIRKELDRLAFEAHRGQQDLRGSADIRQADLLAALLRASANPDARVGQLQIYLRDRAGILVEHGVEMVQFPHRTFQEYLAACHLANDDYPDKLAALLRADPQRWREVTLLAAAHAARGNAEHPTWLLAEELCPCVPGEGAASADAWGALLAGQVVVAAGQHVDCRPRNQHKLDAVRGAQVALLRGRWLPAAERALAGRTLAMLGDPRPEVTTIAGMEFCWVPPGPFEMGANEFSKDEQPCHRVELPYGYFIGRFPISAAQWQEYVRASGDSQVDARSLAISANEPAQFQTRHDAQRFCAWLTFERAASLPDGWRATLPSEAEWEKAARGGVELPGGDRSRTAFGWEALREKESSVVALVHANPLPARHWPWGDEFSVESANTEGGVGQPSALGAYPCGRSPYGCEEMAGNVWEWTRSLWDRAYPYDPNDRRRESEDPTNRGIVVLRGGSYFHAAVRARCAVRGPGNRAERNRNYGFRVVLRSASAL